MSKEVKRYDLSTSEGGRAYIKDLFRTDLRRRDFDEYISQTLAADFACALSRHLAHCADAHEALLAERDRLLEDYEEAVEDAMGAAREATALRKDAERYRWLRNSERFIGECADDHEFNICVSTADGEDVLWFGHLDAVIDAALQGEQP